MFHSWKIKADIVVKAWYEITRISFGHAFKIIVISSLLFLLNGQVFLHQHTFRGRVELITWKFQSDHNEYLVIRKRQWLFIRRYHHDTHACRQGYTGVFKLAEIRRRNLFPVFLQSDWTLISNRTFVVNSYLYQCIIRHAWSTHPFPTWVDQPTFANPLSGRRRPLANEKIVLPFNRWHSCPTLNF